MNRTKFLLLAALAAVLPLSSCSGPKNGGCVTGCNSGGATVSVTLFDTPPAGMTVLSFSLPISGITLTPSSGSNVSVYSPSSIVPTELSRLQTDSAAIVTGASVAAGTYTAINITLNPSSGVFINYSGSSLTYTYNGSSFTCPNGAVCPTPAGAATTVSVPLSLTLTDGQDQWIGLNVNLNNAIVATRGLGVDFTQANTFSATTRVRTGIPSNGVDTVEDFIGAVTASSSSSVTVQNSITGKAITASITSSTEFDSAPTAYSGCRGVASACLTKGAVVSLDALLASNGTYTATEIDVLDASSNINEVEGVIYPTGTAGVYGMVIADKVSGTGNSILGASTTTYGTGISITVSGVNTFSIDTKTLSTPLPNPVGFSSGGLLAGQVVRAQVISIASGAGGISATATNLLLRWSRITGTVSTTAGTTFFLTPPAYISTLNTGLVPPLTSYTYTGHTAFDGISDSSGISAGSTVSVRTLFLDNTLPTFAVAKVRVP